MADAPAAHDDEDALMARDIPPHRQATDEERTFFEALLRLRSTYRRRGSADAESVMLVRHAIATTNAAFANATRPRGTRTGTVGN
jgi:hypothetical protein